MAQDTAPDQTAPRGVRRAELLRPHLTEYAKGYIDGLSAYAWWKDGTQYVGTTGTTLGSAIDSFLDERPS